MTTRDELEWGTIPTFVMLGSSRIMAQPTEQSTGTAIAVTYPFDTATLVDICRENGIVMLGVFGSMARAEADEESDIDLLVEFADDKSLLALVALERKLSEAVGRKVDLLTEDAISPYLRERILGDLQVIYDAR